MGSASTQALAALRPTLVGTAGVDLAVAGELFDAARALEEAPQLRGALSDASAPAQARSKVVADVFGPVLSPVAVSLLTKAADARWSNETELVDGIEELAVRATSVAASGTDLEGELFQVSRVVAANPDLELALGSRLGDSQAKATLVRSILGGRVSDATVLLVASLVRQPRERRVRQLLSRAMAIVADQRGRAVATVTTASALSDAQLDRLKAALSARYGVQVTLNTVIDPTLVGGVRVQLADELIDASVSTRIAELRQRLAG